MKRLVALILITLAPCAAWGDSITLQHGVNSYSGCRDACLRSYAPTTTLGSEDSAAIDGYADETNRSIIAFDLSGIPSGSTITSVTLDMYFGYVNGNASLEMFRVLQSWDESQITHNIRSTGHNWGTAGCQSASDSTFDGSYDRYSTCDVAHTVSGTPAWHTFGSTAGLVASVQAQLDAGKYYGWLIQTHSLVDSLDCSFGTREYAADASYRPKLTVTYTTSGGGTTPSSVQSQILMLY